MTKSVKDDEKVKEKARQDEDQSWWLRAKYDCKWVYLNIFKALRNHICCITCIQIGLEWLRNHLHTFELK